MAFEVNTTAIRLAEVTDLANGLLQEYGLTDLGWTFVLDKSKRRTAQCRYSKMEIGYSMHYLHREWPNIENSIRHEIAHALVGPGYGHGPVWKAKAVEVGARPVSCQKDANSTAQHNYEVECTGCGRRWKRYRLKRNLLNPNVRTACCNAPLKFYRRAE